MKNEKWGPGPWDDEPDDERFDTAVGLAAWVRRVPYGNLCGYVALPPGHPLYGDDELVVDVHGGLTFSGVFEPDDPTWWVGFDCGHWGDSTPESACAVGALTLGGSTYRDIEYVRAECEKLAGQLDVSGWRERVAKAAGHPGVVAAFRLGGAPAVDRVLEEIG